MDRNLTDLPRVKELCLRIGGMTGEVVDALIAEIDGWEADCIEWHQLNPSEVGMAGKFDIAGTAGFPRLPPREREVKRLPDQYIYSLGGLVNDDVVRHFLTIVARSAPAVRVAYGGPPVVLVDAGTTATMLREHPGLNSTYHAVMARLEARPYIARGMSEGSMLLAALTGGNHYNLTAMVFKEAEIPAASLAAPLARAAAEVVELRAVDGVVLGRQRSAQLAAFDAAVNAARAAGEADAKKLERIGEAASREVYKTLEERPELSLLKARSDAAAAACAKADVHPPASETASVLQVAELTVIDSLQSCSLGKTARDGLKEIIRTEHGAFGLTSGVQRGEIFARAAGQACGLACGAFVMIATLFIVLFRRFPEHTDYGKSQIPADLADETRERAADRRGLNDSVALRLIVLDVIKNGRLRWPGMQLARLPDAPPTPAGAFIPRDDTVDLYCSVI